MRQLWEYATVMSGSKDGVRYVTIQHPTKGTVHKEQEDYFKILNEMGKDGWEVVSFFYDSDCDLFTILMKRELLS